jgi:hypothetical protein
VRDAIGYGIDSLLDPLSLFDATLARSLTLTLFQDAKDQRPRSPNSAVRNGYLQRRQRDRARREELKKDFRLTWCHRAESRQCRAPIWHLPS